VLGQYQAELLAADIEVIYRLYVSDIIMYTAFQTPFGCVQSHMSCFVVSGPKFTRLLSLTIGSQQSTFRLLFALCYYAIITVVINYIF